MLCKGPLTYLKLLIKKVDTHEVTCQQFSDEGEYSSGAASKLTRLENDSSVKDSHNITRTLP